MVSSFVVCFKNKERNPKGFGRLLQNPTDGDSPGTSHSPACIKLLQEFSRFRLLSPTV